MIVPMNLELCVKDPSAAKNDFVASAAPAKKHGRVLTLVDAAALTEEQAVAAAEIGIAGGADLALIANATGHLMQTLEEKKIPAGTFGKTVAEPAAVCATTEL